MSAIETAATQRVSAVRVFLAAARVGLGVLFAFAAVSKLAEPSQFAEDIANYRLLPALLVGAAAAVLPGIEIVVSALLIVGLYTRAAAALTLVLLAAFTVALGQALARGVSLSCGCFGASTEVATVWTLLRDFGLMAWAAVLAVFDLQAFSVSPEP